MNPFTKTLLLLFLCSTGWLSAQTDRFQQVSESLRGDLIEEGAPLWSLSDRMKAQKTPAVSIAVVDNFALAGAESYGLVAANDKQQATVDTRFQAASISKLVNAVGVMRLVEEGKIDLDQNINELLTSWQLPPAKAYPDAVITTRMILAHIAGLSAHGFGGYASADKMPSLTAILNKGKGVNSDAVRIIKEPGKAFKYSGGGTTIIQLLIQDVTGQAYEDYIQAAVFQPLGMSQSFYSVNQQGKESQLATAHLYNGKPLKNNYQHYPESAAAGVWTTPSDLAKLMVDLMLTMRGDEGHLLHPATVKEMMTPPLEGENNALGVFVQQKGEQFYFDHSGSNEGFKAQFIGNTKTGEGAIVMTNGERYQLVTEVVNAVATAYEWEEWFSPESTIPKDIELDEAQWKTYTGSYQAETDNTVVLDISVKKGKLIASRPKAFSLQLIPISKTKYLAKGANPSVTVEFMPDGTMQVKQGAIMVFKKQ